LAGSLFACSFAKGRTFLLQVLTCAQQVLKWLSESCSMGLIEGLPR